ncbi:MULTISPECIES: RNA-directed DNA polymerase [Paenibacillus]|nr:MULTISPECIES: RNA-directed DNA polymerase [Paenibacillus]
MIFALYQLYYFVTLVIINKVNSYFVEKGEKMTTTVDLIERGYFPQELPPPFSTNLLSQALPMLQPTSNYRVKTSRYISYDIPRVKLQRRHLSIPNPLHQIKLCEAIEANWTNIQRHYAKSQISISTPVVSTIRAVTPNRGFEDMVFERILRSSSSRVLLRTDISRYYSTIYTHSIPWAVHTKAFAKRNRQNTHYGNLLDECMRNCQDGQTIGIPIGPDTSLIVSEIIGSEIDFLFQQRVGQVKGFRFVDDYYLYFESMSDAEQACSALHQTLREFELDHNLAKTTMMNLPEILEKEWATELRIFDVRSNLTAQKNDIVSFFSKAFDYSIKYPTDPVIKYAVTRSKTFNISVSNWDIYESLLLKTMIVEPSTLQVSLQILLSYDLHGYPLNRTKIAETITEIILHHANFNHFFEISWALWISKSLGISLDIRVANAVSQLNNSIVALVALDLSNSGLLVGLNTTNWQTYLTVNNMYEEQWLLNYEAQVKGWLNAGRTLFTAGSLFSDLNSHNVEFYDTTRQIPTFTPTAARQAARTIVPTDNQQGGDDTLNYTGGLQQNTNTFTFY